MLSLPRLWAKEINMSKHSKSSLRNDSGFVEIKSKFDAEFRRFAVDRSKLNKIESFQETLEKLHFLKDIPFIITYTDIHGDLLPINNDDNFNLALSTAKPVLRILIQRKGESYGENNGYGTAHGKKRNPLIQILSSDNTHVQRPRTIAIGLPEDFRRVSAIIDVDIVPETHRRVKLMKNESDKPLGFYIRDGSSVRVTSQGLEKVPGIFISRLVPGGLAESTGLLAVNDEVIEVNGIEVCGKTLDQVTDMMVANSSNLIITVKPVNQRLTLASAVGRHGQPSASGHSRQSSKSFDSDLITEQDDEDEVKDYLSKPMKGDLNKNLKSDRSEKVNRSDASNLNENGEKSEKVRSTDKYDKMKPSTCLERKNRNNDSDRSNGSDRQSGRSNGSDRQSGRSNGSDRQSGRSNGSDRQSGRSNESDRQSGRSNDSDWHSCKSNGSGRRKHEDGDTKEENESPGVVL